MKRVNYLPLVNRKSKIQEKGNPMRPVMRYQSQLLFRRSYKPHRVIRIRPAGKRNLLFRPSRADSHPAIQPAQTETGTTPDIAFSD